MAMIDDSTTLLIIITMIINIAILYFFLFNISLPNDIVTKTIDLHLPDGRAASPFYPPLPPTVSGWLLCESSSNGGCLMQYHHIIAPSWRGVGMKTPQLLPQLQTPDQNGGASLIDTLMPASTEGLQ